MQPTLVTGAHAKMRIAQEEVFGPFLTVIPFRDEADAIEIANAVQIRPHRLRLDLRHGPRAARCGRTGGRHDLAEFGKRPPSADPFGGMKSSGIGRDGGDYSFDFYMETKHVSLARGTHKIQKLGV